jgi:hypothetical protein
VAVQAAPRDEIVAQKHRSNNGEHKNLELDLVERTLKQQKKFMFDCLK